MTETDPTSPIDEPIAHDLRPSLEALLMIADEPLDPMVLAQAVGHPLDVVESALRELADEYTEQGRGFELRELAGGWRFYTRDDYADVVAAYVLEGQHAKLSQAALETLSVVAYKQPISRSRISAIRGVNVDGVVRTLVTRGLIEELGNDATTGAVLYGTTSYFLERMGLGSLDEMPELAPLLPELDDLDGELERVAGREAEQSAPADPRTVALASVDADADADGGPDADVSARE